MSVKFAFSRNESLIYYCPGLIEENVKSQLCDSCILTMWSVKEKETRDFIEQSHLCLSLKLIKYGAVCGRMTAVIDFSV